MDYNGKMHPVGLIVCYLALCNKLGNNLDNDYLFPNACAKFEKNLPTHAVAIQISQTPITYNNYRSRLKKHMDDETLKDMGVSAVDYSTHSFRRGGLSISQMVRCTPLTSRTVLDTNVGNCL